MPPTLDRDSIRVVPDDVTAAGERVRQRVVVERVDGVGAAKPHVVARAVVEIRNGEEVLRLGSRKAVGQSVGGKR